jgi:hypothetical protein
MFDWNIHIQISEWWQGFFCGGITVIVVALLIDFARFIGRFDA